MRAAACVLAVLLGACASAEPVVPVAPPAAKRAVPSPALSKNAPAAPAAPAVTAASLDAYKRQVAQRIVSASPHVYDGPVQPMLKSIVVLDITIDRLGQLAAVKVRRSNGYRDLENRAIESVRRAAPFAAPPALGRGASLNYLETFLFRDDGRFRVRSLVES